MHDVVRGKMIRKRSIVLDICKQYCCLPFFSQRLDGFKDLPVFRREQFHVQYIQYLAFYFYIPVDTGLASQPELALKAKFSQHPALFYGRTLKVIRVLYYCDAAGGAFGIAPASMGVGYAGIKGDIQNGIALASFYFLIFR